MELGYIKETSKSFDEVVENLETKSPENQFRVLAVHNVQETLSEKGFERGPLKIIEICNAGFAHEALKQSMDVAMFMPCKFTVYTKDGKTIVTLARPELISEMLPGSGLEDLAKDVESKLKKIMDDSI